MSVRFAAICSTGGAVVRHACSDAFVAERLAGVVTDRPCGAEDLAAELGVPAARIEARGDAFGRGAADALDAMGADVAAVFFTRLLTGDVLTRYARRLYNFHPSLLPAFPGLHGIEDALAAGARVLGSTVHVVDAGMDTGPIVSQASFPVDDVPFEVVRHQVFVDQVRSLVQLVHWLDEGRVRVEGRVATVEGAATPVDARYVPPLEAPTALAFDPPPPGTT